MAAERLKPFHVEEWVNSYDLSATSRCRNRMVRTTRFFAATLRAHLSFLAMGIELGMIVEIHTRSLRCWAMSYWVIAFRCATWRMFLAQANIAFFRWPLDDSRMEGFASRIDEMNQLAESSGGFIWRFTGRYDPTGRESPFDSPFLFFNLSVWHDIDSLRNYVFKSDHVQMLRQKSDWTRPTGTSPLAMWWLAPDADMPTVDDAIAHLKTLENNVGTRHAFTFESTEHHRRG